MDSLPFRIMKMIQLLHRRGYTSLFLYSGLSPSGMNWRYQIGLLRDQQWPVNPSLVSGSLGSDGKVAWAEDTGSVESLCDGFQSFYAKLLVGTWAAPTDYSRWYKRTINGLKPNEWLVFFADDGGSHAHLLKDAPGYCGR